MINGGQLNDDYEIHKRRFDHITKDELEELVAEAHLFHPRWYNSILARLGDDFINIGRSLKEQNTGVKPSDLPVSMRQYETFPE